MLLHCNNPRCKAPFDFRQGRMFRFFEAAGKAEASSKAHGVRHFWLCAACSQIYTLEYRRGQVTLLSRDSAPLRAGEPLPLADPAPHESLSLSESTSASTKVSRKRNGRPSSRRRSAKRYRSSLTIAPAAA